MFIPNPKTWALAGVALLGLGGVLIEIRGWWRSDPGKLVAAVRLALKERQWSRAEALLKRLSYQRSPCSEDAVLRAELELGLGRADEAVRILSGIAETDGLAASSRHVAGQIERSRNRVRRAEALFLDAVRLSPRLEGARRELIHIYGMQARRVDLKAQYRALAEMAPLKFDEVLLWTVCSEDVWINDTIRPELEKFLTADPEDRSSRLAPGRGAPRCGSSGGVRGGPWSTPGLEPGRSAPEGPHRPQTAPAGQGPGTRFRWPRRARRAGDPARVPRHQLKRAAGR